MSKNTTFRGVPVEGMPGDEYRELSADDPKLVARRESRALHDQQIVTVSLPMGVWRAITPAIVNNLVDGTQEVEYLRTMLAATDAAHAKAVANGMPFDEVPMKNLDTARVMVEYDTQLGQLLRFAIARIEEDLGAQSEDLFYAVDAPMLMTGVDEVIGEQYTVPADTIMAMLSPETIAEHMEFDAKLQREQEANAQSEVTQELAKFARDTDSSGHTLN